MDADVPLFETRSRRSQFFDRLRSLIDEFPEITDRQRRQWEHDPHDEHWQAENGYPAFDPKAPIAVEGILLIVSCRNLDGYENIAFIEPHEQSHFMTKGLLAEAADYI